MKSVRNLVPVGFMALALAAAGCDKKEDPKPDPAQAASGKTAVNSPNSRKQLNVRNPMGPANRIDPQTMKDYRLDVCYYGTLSLRQARDAYLASLGKDEPSEKKIPSFGIPAAPAAPGAPAAAGSASAAPSAAAKAPPAPAPAPKPAAPAGSASAAASAVASGAAPGAPPMDRHADFAMRAPHERHARACTAGLALKEPAMGDVDAALANYAPFALDLAKDIGAANNYYQHEEYKKDSFAKGKELDKKLRESFAKLDDLEGKLATALDAWRKAHPPDLSKAEEGEKTVRTAIDAARDLVLMVVYKKADAEAYKAAADKLDGALGAVKAFAGSHPADPWAKITSAPVDALAKTVKEAKVTADKTYDNDNLLALVNNFANLIESRQRAISRASMAKMQQLPGGHPPIAPAGGSAAPAPGDAPPAHE